MTSENKEPERIWATEDKENFGEDSFHSTFPTQGLTECVRADLFEASAAMASRQNALIDTLRDELAKEKAKSARLVDALKACVSSLERADTAEGVCCCGDNMEGHGAPMNCGHSPIDMGDYYASKALEAASAALATYKVKT